MLPHYKLIAIFCSLLLLRFIVFLSKYWQTKSYYKKYLDYIGNPSYKFDEIKPQIVKLFEEAGIKNFTISRLEPAGFNKIRKLEINGFQNLALIDSELITIVHQKFHEAIGIFRNRMIQSFNPIFWLEFIFKLPSHLFKYLGLNSDNLFVKIVQIVYWVLAIILAIKELGLI